MGSARKLLLIVLVVAAEAYTDATLNSLTLSPTLITTQENPISPDTLPNTVIGSAASDSVRSIKTSIHNTVVTTAPAAAPCESDSNSILTFNSSGQDAIEHPASGPTIVSPGSVSDRNSNDLATQTGSRTLSAPVTSPSDSSRDAVELLNQSTGQLSSGGSTGITTALPVVFGALACVGALVMVVTYKRKRGVKENDGSRSSLDWANFLPEDRALSVVQEKRSIVAMTTPDIGTHGLAASACVVDCSGANSSVSSTSSFGSTWRTVRAGSTVLSSNSVIETSMEFQEACLRHEEGIDVVLTFNEGHDSSRLAPQVQL